MPLFLIREVINKLKEIKYFNKLDLIWGYNNVQIKEGDKWKAEFLTKKDLFEPKVIYFRLCNSPGMLQRIINSIFRELLYKGVLANYMNDFVILAKTRKKLEEQIIQFLKVIEKHNICFKQSVTNFILLVSQQQVDWFSQNKLYWKALDEGYLYICGIYKSNNKWLRYQAISNYKSFVC